MVVLPILQIAQQGDDHRVLTVSPTDSTQFGQNRVQVEKRLSRMLPNSIAYNSVE